MQPSTTLTIRSIPREDMFKRIAFFRDMVGFNTGFSTGNVPNTDRTLYNVMGNEPPANGKVSAVGDDATKHPAIDAVEPFNLTYACCKPGNGPLMHNHDTSETFIPVSGRWRLSWNEDDTQHVEVGPYDIVSFPPNVPRRFENITHGEPDTEHMLIVIVAGKAPIAENTPKSWEIIRRHESQTA